MNTILKLKKLHVFLIAIGIIIGALTIFFFVYYGEIGLFNFPFLANVWGTAADWTVATITAMTIIYIIKTFEEQRKTNQKTIDNYKYLILPMFTVSEKIIFNPDSKTFYFELILKKNSAYYVAPARKYGGILDPEDIPMKLFLSEDDTIKIKCIRENAAQYEFLFNTIYQYSFRDIMGNTYFQEVLIKNDHTLSLGSPQPAPVELGSKRKAKKDEENGQTELE